MKAIERFLKKELFGKELATVIVLLIAIDLCWDVSVLPLIEFFGKGGFSSHVVGANVRDLYSWCDVVVIEPCVEEFMFRLPLAIIFVLVTEYLWKKGNWLVAVLSAAAVFSVLFGWLHGNVFNILIQGVGGFLLSILFLKSGGLQGRPWKAFFASSAAHGLKNGVVMAVAIILQN